MSHARGTTAPDGEVDVVRGHVLAQVHGSMCLSHADDGLQMAHGHGHALAHGSLLAQSSVCLQGTNSLKALRLCSVL